MSLKHYLGCVYQGKMQHGKQNAAGAVMGVSACPVQYAHGRERENHQPGIAEYF